MASQHQYLALYRQALDALTSDTALDAEEEKYIDRAAAALMRIIKRRSGPAPELGKALPVAPEDTPPLRSYDGLSVAEAAVAYLQTLPDKEAKAASEIIDHLQDHGYEFSTDHPDVSLSTALRRRASNYMDIIRVKRGRWGLREWYTQKEVTEFSQRERTIAGMEAAKARGVRMGQPWKITADQAAYIKRRLAEGAKQTDLAREFGCASNTIYRYKKLLAKWNPGDAFPPEFDEPERSEENSSLQERPKLRAVE